MRSRRHRIRSARAVDQYCPHSGARGRRRCRSRRSRPPTRSLGGASQPSQRQLEDSGPGFGDAGLGGHDHVVDEPAEPELAEDPAQRDVPVRHDGGAKAQQPQAAQRRRGVRVGAKPERRSSASMRSSGRQARRPGGSCSASTAAQRARRSASEVGDPCPPCGGAGSRTSPRASPPWPARRDLDAVMRESAPAAAATAARARPACRARRTARPRTGRRRRARRAAAHLRPSGGRRSAPRAGSALGAPTASTRTGMPFRCAMPGEPLEVLGVRGRELVHVRAARPVGELPSAAVAPAVRQRDRARRHLVRDA